MEPYHQYVFDIEKRKFVGQFEEMYRQEDEQNFDSWYQDDMSHLANQLALTLLQKYNFGKILDIGCGKGTFTSLLKKENNYVVGWDVSETAVRKCRSKYKNIRFEAVDVRNLEKLEERYDLVVIKEVLSYLDNWREVLKRVAGSTEYLLVTLFLPPNPIGFVKNFEELKEEIGKHFEIVEDVFLVVNNQKVILAKRK